MPEPRSRTSQSSSRSASRTSDLSRSSGARQESESEARPAENRFFAAPQQTSSQARRTETRGVPDMWSDAWRSPFAPFAMMQTEMTRWMDEFWRPLMSQGMMSQGMLGRTPGMTLPGLTAAPRVDMKETRDDYRLDVELPGLKAQDIDVRLDGDGLIVRATKAETAERRPNENYHLSERRFGAFERRVPLPRGIDRDNIEAEFRDGVLSVTVPKRDDGGSHGRRISVRQGPGARS